MLKRTVINKVGDNKGENLNFFYIKTQKGGLLC